MKYLNYKGLQTVNKDGTEEEKAQLIEQYKELLNEAIETLEIVNIVCEEVEVLTIRTKVERIIRVNTKKSIIKPKILNKYLEKIKIDSEDYQQIKEIIILENTISWYEYVISVLEGKEELPDSEE